MKPLVVVVPFVEKRGERIEIERKSWLQRHFGDREFKQYVYAEQEGKAVFNINLVKSAYAIEEVLNKKGWDYPNTTLTINTPKMFAFEMVEGSVIKTDLKTALKILNRYIDKDFAIEYYKKVR